MRRQPPVKTRHALLGDDQAETLQQTGVLDLPADGGLSQTRADDLVWVGEEGGDGFRSARGTDDRADVREKGTAIFRVGRGGLAYSLEALGDSVNTLEWASGAE